MKHTIQIYCKNNNNYKDFPIGSRLLDIYFGFDLKLKNEVVSARVNNRTEGLTFRVYNNKDIEFLDITSPSGMRAYFRSICFVLYKAVCELYPGCKLYIEHPV
ncbi:MAG: nucleoside kinase, partial [Bacteroidaceae bacterium]|nr:nucleoside kinase [Bacteroidaceae bacterium]